MRLPGVGLELPEEGEGGQSSQVKCNVNLLCPINRLTLKHYQLSFFRIFEYLFGFEEGPAGFIEGNWAVVSGTKAAALGAEEDI